MRATQRERVREMRESILEILKYRISVSFNDLFPYSFGPFVFYTSRGLDVNTYTSNKSISALMYACIKTGENYRRMVKFLLSKGANVDHCSNDKDTAIIWAAIGGDAEIVRSILEKHPHVILDCFYLGFIRMLCNFMPSQNFPYNNRSTKLIVSGLPL